MKKIAKKVMTLFILVIMSAAILFGADKKPTYILRFGHVLTENDTFNKYMEKAAEEIKTATNGDFVIEIYPNALLGNEEDVLEQIRQGANIGWQTDFARLGNYVPELSVMNAPFFISNLDELEKLTKSPSIQKWDDELAKKFGIRNFSFTWAQGDRVVFANKKATSPAEMKGLSIRTAPAPIWVESVNALGCKAVSLPYGEMYTGIQTKVVDGAEQPYNAAKNIKLEEVCKYVMETGHIFAINTMVVSEEWYQKLPDNYKKLLVDTFNKLGIEAAKKLEEQTASSKKAMVDAGIIVVPKSELDLKAFIKASDQAYKKLNLEDARKAVYNDIGKKVEE